MKVLFVGDKPSSAMKTTKPFVGAKCEARFREWAKEIAGGYDYHVVNQVNYTTSELKILAETLKVPVVALGNVASKALGKTPHLKIGHPSGLNRKINNKRLVKKMLKEAREYVEINNVAK